MRSPRTAQELMDEIDELRSLIEKMDRAILEIAKNFHILTGCKGAWEYSYISCSDPYGDSPETWRCKFLSKIKFARNYDDISKFYEDKKEKIDRKIKRLMKKRHDIALSVPRKIGGINAGSKDEEFKHASAADG